MTVLINILLGIYLFVCVIMMLVILMQRPKSEGLGAAFGGGMTENLFGAQTTNVLTKVTGWLAAIFFLLTFVLSILYARKANTGSSLGRELTKGATPAPVASATPVPGSSASVAPTGSATPTASPNGSALPIASATVTSIVATPMTPTPSVAPATSPATSVAPANTPAASASASVAASPKR
jgi:preprotein translocase subunit SecG